MKSILENDSTGFYILYRTEKYVVFLYKDFSLNKIMIGKSILK